MLAANTQFQKRKGKLWTFQDRASGEKRQLDYILVRKKWRNSVRNAEAYSSFSTVSSDHRVVTARISLSLRVSKPKARVKLDWPAFSRSQELQQQYSVAVRNRFQILEENVSNNQLYTEFVKANTEAMEEFVPKRKRNKRTPLAQHPSVVTARQAII